MQAGKLRNWVTIQTRVETRSASGGSTITFEDAFDLPAQVTDIRGQEFFAASQLQSSVSSRIRIRYDSRVRVGMGVKFVEDVDVTRQFEIQNILRSDTSRREMQLMCIERQSDGFRS